MIDRVEHANSWLMSRSLFNLLLTAFSLFALAATMPDGTTAADIIQAMMYFWRGVSVTIVIFHLIVGIMTTGLKLIIKARK